MVNTMDCFFKKGVRVSAVMVLLLSSLLSPKPVNAGGWCMMPICPGDILFDSSKITESVAFETAREYFHQAQKMVSLINQIKNETLLAGQKMTGDVNRTLMGVSKKSDVKTNIINLDLRMDQAPIADTAFNLLETANSCQIENPGTGSAEVFNLNANDIISGSSESSQGYDFYDLYKENFNDNHKPINPGVWLSKSEVSGDDKAAAIMNVDLIAGNNQYSGLDVEPEISDKETKAYQREKVDLARKAVVQSVVRDGLLTQVEERVGYGSAPSKVRNLEKMVNDNGLSDVANKVADGETITPQMWRKIAIIKAIELKITLENYKKWLAVEQKMAVNVLVND